MDFPKAYITTAAELGYFTESCLGPDTLVRYQPILDGNLMKYWGIRIDSHGVHSDNNIAEALNDWYAPMLAKGITSFPPPQTLSIWEHSFYNGNIYVYDTPVILVISKNKGATLLDYSWEGYDPSKE